MSVVQSLPTYYWIIFITAFFTSIVSAALGMIGGSLLLAVMAQWLDMTVVIPVHGLIQLWSNTTRAFFLRTYIDKSIVKENALGILAGGALALVIVIRPPENLFDLLLGIFIFMTTLLPQLHLPWKFRGRWFIMGIASLFVGLYFGAIGILVGAGFLAEGLKKNEMVATQAVCQAMIHLAKILIFLHFGFQLGPWLSLITGTLTFTLAGTWVGTIVLERIPERLFHQIVTAVIALLSLRLIWTGLQSLL